MKRVLRSKIAIPHALPVTTALFSGPLWAHPEIAGHAAAPVPAHGMFHAVLDAPALMVVAGIALGAAWALLRLRRGMAVKPRCEPQSNRE